MSKRQPPEQVGYYEALKSRSDAFLANGANPYQLLYAVGRLWYTILRDIYSSPSNDSDYR